MTLRDHRLATVCLALGALSLAAVSAVAQSPARDRAALEKRLTDVEASKDWAAALEAGLQLNAIEEGEHVTALYRVARLHALLGSSCRRSVRP